jgi:hypothetical protein
VRWQQNCLKFQDMLAAAGSLLTIWPLAMTKRRRCLVATASNAL